MSIDAVMASSWTAPVLRTLRSPLQALERAVDRERSRFLAGRELLECAEELPDVLLSRHHHEQMLDAPSFVVHPFLIRGLERIGAQIEELRQPQPDERLLPDVQPMLPLLGEDDLPLVVAQRDQ